MPPQTLGSDATISDTLQELKDPEEYVRGVLGNMATCRKQYGDAYVLIGTTGHGFAPHHRIQPRKNADADFNAEAVDDDDDVLHWVKNIDAYYVAFHGRSHKKLGWDMLKLQSLHWSTRSMSFGDVQDLLGNIRTHKAKRR